MDQSLCACSCTHVASLQRSTLHISNWKIVFVFVVFCFVFSGFVCLFCFTSLLLWEKWEKKECYNSDWVRSGLERGERGLSIADCVRHEFQSVTVRLSAIDPRQCWNLQGWWTISATVPETRAPFNLSLSAASSTSEITYGPLLFTHRHCSFDTSETDFVFPFQYLIWLKIQMLKDAQSFLLSHSLTSFLTRISCLLPKKSNVTLSEFISELFCLLLFCLLTGFLLHTVLSGKLKAYFQSVSLWWRPPLTHSNSTFLFTFERCLIQRDWFGVMVMIG